MIGEIDAIDIENALFSEEGLAGELDSSAQVSEAPIEGGSESHPAVSITPVDLKTLPRRGCAYVLDPDDQISRHKSKQIRLAIGDVKKRAWRTESLTLADLIGLLTKHTEGPKDGVGILQGSLSGEERRKEAVNKNEIIALDIDNGDLSLNEIVMRLKNLGWLAIVHTTHSHGTTQSYVREKAITDWMQKEGRSRKPTLTDFRDYLLHQGKHSEKDLSGFSVGQKGLFEDISGAAYPVKHAPMTRLRIIVVLKEPFRFVVDDVTQDKRMLEWSERYAGVAALVGATYDKACSDPNRLMYLPRCDASRMKDATAIIIGGDPLDLKMVDRRPSKNEAPTPQIGERQAAGGAVILKTQGLMKFLATNGSQLAAADMLAELEPENVRSPIPAGGYNFRCPNAAVHSDGDNPKDQAFMVVNARDNLKGTGFYMGCMHATCKELSCGDRAYFLDLFMQQHKLTTTDLGRWCKEPVVENDNGDPCRNGREKLWPSLSVDDEFTLVLSGARQGRPQPTERNVILALRKLAIVVRHDEFRNVVLVDGYRGFGPILSDSGITALRFKLNREFNIDISAVDFTDLITNYANHNAFHPIRDYLETVEVQWDGAPRIDTMLTHYFGAVDTPLCRQTGKCWMIAAVRRIRKPGTKFDQALIFEGPQGGGKSTGLQILAGDPKSFSDDLPIGADSKITIEKTRGIWIAEFAELSGMKNREIETVKAFLSRQVDVARSAYGRIPERVPRQFICAGTTNSGKYLKDTTGHRRFWPVRCSKEVDHAGLERDRDQLWAEAAVREKQGESIILDRELWDAAAEQQADRTVENAYFDILQEKLSGTHNIRIASTAVYELLDVKSTSRHDGIADSVRRAMEALGFTKNNRVKNQNGTKVRGFTRGSGETLVTAELGIGQRYRARVGEDVLEFESRQKELWD